MYKRRLRRGAPKGVQGQRSKTLPTITVGDRALGMIRDTEARRAAKRFLANKENFRLVGRLRRCCKSAWRKLSLNPSESRRSFGQAHEMLRQIPEGVRQELGLHMPPYGLARAFYSALRKRGRGEKVPEDTLHWIFSGLEEHMPLEKIQKRFGLSDAFVEQLRGKKKHNP